MQSPSTTIPEHFIPAYNAGQIRQRTTALGAEITPWAKSVLETTGQQLLAVCVLRGGVYFFADLLREIEATVEPGFCRTWSYSSSSNEQTDSSVRVALNDLVVDGRAILLIDDICDTGATLLKLQNVFIDLGAKEVRSAVFVHRLMSDAKHTPTYAAYQYGGPEWFVGYGMEDRNHYSNLPGLYTIRPAGE